MQEKVKIIEGEICPDHVHMLAEIPPSMSVSYFVGYLKGKSTLMIFERHAKLKYKYGKENLFLQEESRNFRYLKAEFGEQRVSEIIENRKAVEVPVMDSIHQKRKEASL